MLLQKTMKLSEQLKKAIKLSEQIAQTKQNLEKQEEEFADLIYHIKSANLNSPTARPKSKRKKLKKCKSIVKRQKPQNTPLSCRLNKLFSQHINETLSIDDISKILFKQGYKNMAKDPRMPIRAQLHVFVNNPTHNLKRIKRGMYKAF